MTASKLSLDCICPTSQWLDGIRRDSSRFDADGGKGRKMAYGTR